jgi:protein transport protein SEC24
MATTAVAAAKNHMIIVFSVPEEFQYDPMTKTYGDPTRRPEVNSGTIEFLAPADYMVRPPQAAVYLFVLETTPVAIETGYLKIVCDSLLDNLESLPGDSRTQIGFITFNKYVQFYNLSKEFAQPAQINVCDVDDCFVPCPEGLLVPLKDNMDNVRALLTSLPAIFYQQVDADAKNCLGAAVQVACKMMVRLSILHTNCAIFRIIFDKFCHFSHHFFSSLPIFASFLASVCRFSHHF